MIVVIRLVSRAMRLELTRRGDNVEPCVAQFPMDRAHRQIRLPRRVEPRAKVARRRHVEDAVRRRSGALRREEARVRAADALDDGAELALARRTLERELEEWRALRLVGRPLAQYARAL